MFDVGSFRARTCTGVSRRGFLRLSATLPAAFGAQAAAKALAEQAAEEVKAKSVLLIWLWGAPSHIDTFDPKPEAPAEIRGPFAPIKTAVPGVYFSELLPRLAQRNDKFALIRSMVTDSTAHPPAGTWGLTGFASNPEPVHPNFGAIVAKHHLTNLNKHHATHQSELPPFMAVGRGHPKNIKNTIRGFGGGRLGRQYDPFLVTAFPDGKVDLPALQLLDGMTPNRMHEREVLLQELGEVQRGLDKVGIAEWDKTYQAAYGLLTNPASRAAFDLSSETEATRAAYGYTTFGQSCLLARRLVQAHVPYIQVNWSEYVEAMTPGCDYGWDMHINNFELLGERHCPIFDRAFSALLDDLETRGLLKDTLVVAMGEFGRTPKLNVRASRDHHKDCYFSIWAGAGVEGGNVIGESDKNGSSVLSSPVKPLMVGTTICDRAGVNVQHRTEMGVLPEGRAIPELFS